MMQSESVELRSGMPEEFRREVAEIVYQAFQRKFVPLIGSPEQGVAILEKGIDPAMAIIAVCQGHPVGVAGLQYDGRNFIIPQRSAFVRQFGALSGTARFVLFKLFIQAYYQQDMYIDVLAVSPAMRGKGVGTRLLEAVFQTAREKGFKSVSLEVVDTNPDARRLYERVGFVARHTYPYPYLRGIAGFSASIKMVKPIGSDDFGRPTD
jgi:ribosomal protein S18 acetylase RimI-like enzyme